MKKKTAFAEPRPLISLAPIRQRSQSVPQLIKIRVSEMARKIYTICSRSNGLNGNAQKSINSIETHRERCDYYSLV